MINKDGDYNLRKKLLENGVSIEDIEYIFSYIQESSLDAYCRRFPNSVYKLFVERNIWDAFEKSLHDLNIVLYHTNEPEQ